MLLNFGNKPYVALDVQQPYLQNHYSFAPTRVEGQANPLVDHVLSRQFLGVNTGQILSLFHVSSVLDALIQHGSEDAPSP